MWRAPLFELPQGEAHGTRDHHTRTIAYLIQMCCPDEKDSLLQLTRHSDGVFGRPVRTSFAMDSKELSSILDCFGDQKAIKTPKLNTI